MFYINKRSIVFQLIIIQKKYVTGSLIDNLMQYILTKINTIKYTQYYARKE